MRAPVVRATFDELVAETVRELEQDHDERLLALSEDDVLRQLADYQRDREANGAYTVRARATALGLYTYWHRHRRGRR
jgi:hypothetical protein